MSPANKHLGQHWLRDRETLAKIASYAEVTDEDVVFEIGPGLGTLTSVLLNQAKKVVAVEFDENLANKLAGQFPGKNLEVIESDILSFNLQSLPPGYKVVANIPYYITNKIIQLFMTAGNKPSLVVLLVQKEVAQRLAAKPGDMSILSVSAQLFAEVSLGQIVSAKLFSPVPKVDSQVVILKPRLTPLFPDLNEKLFFKVVKAGFSAKRKKLRSSLAGGLHIDKNTAEKVLLGAKLDPNDRAETLSLESWATLTANYADIIKT